MFVHRWSRYVAGCCSYPGVYIERRVFGMQRSILPGILLQNVWSLSVSLSPACSEARDIYFKTHRSPLIGRLVWTVANFGERMLELKSAPPTATDAIAGNRFDQDSHHGTRRCSYAPVYIRGHTSKTKIEEQSCRESQTQIGSEPDGPRRRRAAPLARVRMARIALSTRR